MKATALYRTASILLFVAAAGNTYAVVRFWQAAGAMNSVPLPEDHRLTTAQCFSHSGCSVHCVFCSAHILPGIWVRWQGQLLKPLVLWDGRFSRINSLGST